MSGITTPFSKMILYLLWIGWCVLHSFLISSSFTGYVQKKIGKWFAFYRFSYVLLSIGTLIPLALHHFSRPQQIIFDWPGYLVLIKLVLLGYAVVCIVASIPVYDAFALFGLKQIHSFFTKQKLGKQHFTTEGVLGYVRHPLYSAGVALILGMGTLTDINLPVRGILLLYVIVGSHLEERKLVTEFGKLYRDYQQQVPMLVPWKFFHTLYRKNK